MALSVTATTANALARPASAAQIAAAKAASEKIAADNKAKADAQAQARQTYTDLTKKTPVATAAGPVISEGASPADRILGGISENYGKAQGWIWDGTKWNKPAPAQSTVPPPTGGSGAPANGSSVGQGNATPPPATPYKQAADAVGAGKTVDPALWAQLTPDQQGYLSRQAFLHGGPPPVPGEEGGRPNPTPGLPNSSAPAPTPVVPAGPDWSAVAGEIISAMRSNPLSWAQGGDNNYKTSGGFSLSQLPKEARKLVDDFSNSNEFTELVLAADRVAAAAAPKPPQVGGGSGPPGGAASFVTDNRQNTQAPVNPPPEVPSMVTPPPAGGTPPVSPVTGVVPGGGGTNAGISPPAGGTPPPTAGVPLDEIFRLIDLLNAGTGISSADFAKLSPQQKELLKKQPGFKLADAVPPGGTTPPVVPVDPATGVVPGGGGTNAGISPPGETPPPAGVTPPAGGTTPTPAPEDTLTQQINEMIGQLKVNADTERKTIERNYDEQRVKLARMYALDPSSIQNGKAIRDFEELASAEADALSAVDARVREETRTNIASLLGVQATRSQTDVAGRAQTLAETATAEQQRLAREALYGGGPDQKTLAAQELAQRGEQFQAGQTLAREQLYGGAQDVSARSLGLTGTFTQPALVTAFTTQMGRAPTAAELSTLMAGGSIKGGPQTLEAQQLALQAKEQEEAAAARTAALTGDLAGQQTLAAKNFAESQRQFDAAFLGTMTNPDGTIKEGLDKQRLEQARTEFSQNLNLQKQELALRVGSTWAQLTGTTGTPAPVSAADLGVDLTNVSKGLQIPGALLVSPEASAIRASFKAMTGKEATPDQVLSLLQGQSLNVEGAPTLEARKLASDIVSTTLNREADLKKTADTLDLEYAQLKELSDNTDREWALKTQDVAERNDLDAMQFKQAQMQLEHTIDLSERQFANQAGMAWAQITGKTGTPGPVDARALGVDTSKIAGYNTPQALLSSPEAGQLRERITAMVGTPPTDAQLQTLLTGGQIQVANTPTLEATKAAAQIQQIADAQGLDVKKFVESSRQFREQFDLSKEQVAQSMGIQKDQADAALSQIEEQQKKEKTYWDGLMAGARKPITINLSDPEFTPTSADGKPLFDRGKMQQELGMQEIARREGVAIPPSPEVEKLRQWGRDAIGNGEELTDAQILSLVEGKPLTIQALGRDWYNTFSTEQRQEILALINGGQFQTSQGGGLSGAIGQFLGQLATTLPFLI